MTTPPLLLLAEGRRPRPRKAPQVRPKEIELHMAVTALLRKHCRHDWLWTHVPNGELRDIRVAAKLKRMGAQAGWPDFVMVAPGGRFHALELKRVGEALSDAQEAFQHWAIVHGVPYVVAYSMDEVLVALREWGCLTDDAHNAGVAR